MKRGSLRVAADMCMSTRVLPPWGHQSPKLKPTTPENPPTTVTWLRPSWIFKSEAVEERKRPEGELTMIEPVKYRSIKTLAKNHRHRKRAMKDKGGDVVLDIIAFSGEGECFPISKPRGT